jgi:hypothetical protein
VATISTHIITGQNPPKLHNNQTNREEFRTRTENFLLNVPLKTAKGIGEAVAEFTNVIEKGSVERNTRRQTLN